MQKIANDGTTTTTTTYIDGFVYLNSVLSYFPTPEGRVTNNGGVLSNEYVISDNQGNARITFNNTTSVNGAKVIQENSFYGFGMVMAGSTVTTPTPQNKNLYNGGSEWQNQFTNDQPGYYETFYRNYDAALGRFIGIDPETEGAESLTGYNYSGNNPIMFNDPLGDDKKVPRYTASPSEAINYLLNSEYGGGWSRTDGLEDENTLGDEIGLVGFGIQNYQGDIKSISSLQYVNNVISNAAEFALGLVANQGGFPSFATLLKNYPMPYSPGPYSQDLYYNQCAIRCSIALQKSGVDLSNTKNLTNPGGQTFTRKGEVLGAYNLAMFLRGTNVLGKPEVFNGTTQNIPSLLNGRTGIIFFQGFVEDGSRTDEARHIDLWNGSGIRAPYYSQMMDSRTIWFWPVK